MTPVQVERDDRILVFSPTGREPAASLAALEAAGLRPSRCADAESLAAELERGAGAVLLAEEDLTPAAFERLRGALARQPAWSDLPLVVLCAAERLAPALQRWAGAQRLPLLLPPTAPEVLVEALRAALVARRRQVAAGAAHQESERRKDQFLSHVGHELRNPLAAISNGVCVLRQPGSQAPERVARVAEIIERQTRQLVRLVDELLDVSRITTGRITLERRPLELGEIVERCRAAAATPERPLPIERDGAPLWIDADAGRIEQALEQILAHAAQGGARELRLGREGGQAVLRIHDGSGAAEALAQLLEPFRLPMQARERGAGGLGVGLTIARSLIELHGGSVAATSVDGGTEISVRLPLRPADKGAAPGRRRIVIVEDNPDLSETLQELLQDLGHEVSVAPDGQSGVARVLATRPDVALIDIGLPDFDGYEVARRIREAGTQGVKLVAMTGYGQAEDRRRAEAAGFDTHMTKPPRLDLLQKLLLGRDAS